MYTHSQENPSSHTQHFLYISTLLSTRFLLLISLNSNTDPIILDKYIYLHTCFLFSTQPERILGGEYGIHSEVWSLGVSVLEVCAQCGLCCTLSNNMWLFHINFIDFADGIRKISLLDCK